jgi:hypothetical protein
MTATAKRAWFVFKLSVPILGEFNVAFNDRGLFRMRLFGWAPLEVQAVPLLKEPPCEQLVPRAELEPEFAEFRRTRR